MVTKTTLLGVGLFGLGLSLLRRISTRLRPANREREPEHEGPDDPDVQPPSPNSSSKGSSKPLHVARRGDPQLEALLVELGQFLTSHGVDTSIVSPAELTIMPKTPGPAYAVPQRALWPNIIGAAKLVMVLRSELGFPLRIAGYRPADYNKAVGGAPRSQHVQFGAIDYRPAGEHNTSANRRKLALVSARLFLARPTEKIGLGLYGYPVPSNGHVDTGFGRRTWEETKKYLNEAIATLPANS